MSGRDDKRHGMNAYELACEFQRTAELMRLLPVLGYEVNNKLKEGHEEVRRALDAALGSRKGAVSRVEWDKKIRARLLGIQ